MPNQLGFELAGEWILTVVRLGDRNGHLPGQCSRWIWHGGVWWQLDQDGPGEVMASWVEGGGVTQGC